MSERIGNCEQCGQRFGGIPDSVTALKVKCTECGGTVVIPPLPEAPVAAAPPEPPAAEKASAPTPPPTAPAPSVDKPLAAPLGDAKAKGGNRPDSARPVDRDVAAVKKPVPPKKAAKPIVPLKPVAKVAKPIKPLKPVAKPAKPVVPLKKPAAPVKPVKPPVAAKPVAPKPAPPKPVAKPVPPAPPKAVAKPAPPAPPKAVAKPAPPKPIEKKVAAAKPSAADIIAKAKARKAAEAKPAAGAKPSAADIIAKAKAKRSTETAAPAEKKASAADIIAKAKAKRDGTNAPAAKKPALATGAPRKVAVATGKPKIAAGGARKRPAGGGSSSSRSRRRPQEEEYEEKSKAPMFIVGAIVLIGAGFGAWTLMGDAKETVAEGNEVVSVPAETGGTPVQASSENSNTANTAPAASEAASSTPAENASSPSEAANTDSGSSESSEPAPEAAKPAPQPKASSEFTLPAAGERINTRGVTDPALIVLDQVTPVEKAPDTSSDTWNEAVEDLDLYLQDSGASSNRAGNRLVSDYPRAAYPAIINAMLKVDYTTADGMYLAATLNNLLLRIGTKDLSWKATEFFEPGTAEWDSAVVFDKKVVAAWHNLWVETYANSIPAWNNFSKIPAEGGAVEEADTGGIVGPDDDLFD